jgi:hypothetical protein
MRSEPGSKDLAKQSPFDESYCPFRGRLAEAFSAVGLKRSIHGMRRGVLGKLGPD